MLMIDADHEQQALNTKKPEPIDWDKVLDQDNKPKQKATGAREQADKPQDILDGWMVVEALSPEGYKTSEKLATKLYGALISFHICNGEPCFNGPHPRNKNKPIYYLVRKKLLPPSLINHSSKNRGFQQAV